jgi:tRNA pseudouridine55 synthase
MATGLLIIGIESGTKALSFISNASKKYSATIRLGAATVTDDAQGEQISFTDASHLTDEEIRRGLHAMIGEIEQVPARVSAIKVNGERAYAKVRAGEDVELKPRRIKIYSLEVQDIFRAGPFVEVDITVECSSGTYIRSIARDLGNTLGVGGHLTALRRTESSGFTESEAYELDTAFKGLIPLRTALVKFMPEVKVSSEQVALVERGQRLPWIYGDATDAVAVIGPDDALLAIGEHVIENDVPKLGYHSVFIGGAK